MPFIDRFGRVSISRMRPCDQLRRLLTEPHGPAHLSHVTLFVEQTDDRMRRIFIEFGRVGIVQANMVPTELNDCTLHSQADAKKRDAARTSKPNRFDFAFDATLAKSTGNQDAVVSTEQPFGTFAFDIAALNPSDAHLCVVINSRMIDRLIDRLVRVAMLGVLAHHGSRYISSCQACISSSLAGRFIRFVTNSSNWLSTNDNGTS